MYCLCVNVYCHRVSNQLQLTNISISIFLLQILQVYFRKCAECRGSHSNAFVRLIKLTIVLEVILFQDYLQEV
jgi:hypothetical protein